jgi:hypothetical protein
MAELSLGKLLYIRCTLEKEGLVINFWVLWFSMLACFIFGFLILGRREWVFIDFLRSSL